MNKPKFIQPVVIAVIRKENKYLLTQRVQLDKHDYPEFKGQWEIPGGGMEPGENPEEALHREVMEELSIKVKILSPFSFIFTKMRGQWQGLFLCYICEPVDNSPIKLNEESSDFKWVTLDEAAKLETLPGVIEVISAFINP